MDTRVFQPENASEAAALLRIGGLVVFPSETVYGLGANALDPNAVRKIFVAKGRPQDNPLIVHVSEPSGLDLVVTRVFPEAQALMDAFWPGPLTMVLPRTVAVPDEVTAGLDTVGVRLPRSPQALLFLTACGVPVAAPSANLSGSPSPTTFSMAWEAMNGRVNAMVEGPDCEVGLESTVVGFPQGRPVVYRAGAITHEMIASVLGIKPSELAAPPSSRPLAPGTAHPHYRPKAKVRLFRTPEELVAVAKSDWILAPEGFVENPGCTLRHFKNLDAYARALFSFFNEADRAGAFTVWCWLPPEEGLGRALRDRLMRASRP